jgi:hypothetical protein
MSKVLEDDQKQKRKEKENRREEIDCLS